MGDTFVAPLSGDAGSAEVGGKARVLTALLRAGLPVPAGFVVTAAAFRRRAEPGVAEAIRGAYAGLGSPVVAVRPSATPAGPPSAGRRGAVLGVEGAEAVVSAVGRCWVSLDAGPAETAVVVQELVRAESSGILFTVDPVTGADGVIVHAGWGLGETVVDGSITPDTYVVGGPGQRREIGDKPLRMVPAPGGTVVRPVPDRLRHLPVLTEAQAAGLAALGTRIHDLSGPAEVEWARHAGGFAIISARPLAGPGVRAAGVACGPDRLSSTVEGAAIVLAGGTGSRLGGVDKPGLVVAGRTLLDRAVAAVDGARTVVVGPERASVRPVEWTREDPPGGGPVAGLLAALDVLSDLPDDTVTVLLAADLPSVDHVVVARLVAGVRDTGAVLVDSGGRAQWLLSAWRLGVLRGAVPPGGAGMSLRGVLGGLDAARVADTGGAADDIDTPEDLRRHGG